MDARPEVTGKRVSHSIAAQLRGVTGRTIDRWIAAGILPRPEIINRRKYHLFENVMAVGRLPIKVTD